MITDEAMDHAKNSTSSQPRSVDPRSPFVFDVRPLGRRAGSMRAERRLVVAPLELGTEVAGVRAGTELDLNLRLEAVTEGVLVTGMVTAPLQGECARCLDPITDEIIVDVLELFAYPSSVTDTTAADDEVHRITGSYLDVEPAVRDAIVLGLPWTPVCRDDCPGLCPTCGQRLDDLPDDHGHDVPDPRWAALAGRAGAQLERPND